MGKAVIIVLLGVIVIYGVTNLVINQNIGEMSEDSIDTYMQTKARNLGNSAVEVLKAKLGEDDEYRVTSAETMDLDGGSVTYRVVDTTYSGEDLIKLDILSTYLDAIKKIDAFVKIVNSVPPYLDKSVLSENKVVFNGNQLAVKDTNNPTQNADIHSNEEVIMNGSNCLVEGFVTSSGNVTVGGSNLNVIPNSNPLGLPPIQEDVPEIAIPSFVAANYLAKATIVYNSDQTFGGALTLGTRKNPAIIYVNGKVFFNAATTVTGYGLIIAEQDVEFNKNVTVNSPDPYLSKFGVYTSGKILVNNPNTNIAATLYCQMETVLNSTNLKLIGGITSKANVTFNGLKETLYYKEPAYPITYFLTGVTYLRPIIVHWYE